MLRLSRTVHQETGARNLCLAGGVALNCVGNGRVLREGNFEKLWIQPAAGDAGGAIGAAYAAWHEVDEHPRLVRRGQDSMQGAYLGPGFTTAEIAERLLSAGAVFQIVQNDEALIGQAMDAFYKIRNMQRLRKRPSTSELVVRKDRCSMFLFPRVGPVSSKPPAT